LERWQKALANWDIWTKSIQDRRQYLIERFGELKQLKEQLDELHYRDEVLHDLSSNEAQELKRLTNAFIEIVLKTDDIATDFITDIMGISVGSDFHSPIFRYWVATVIPEFLPDFAEDVDFEKYFRKEGLIHIWCESRIEPVGDKEVIVDSICWHRGTATPEEIAEMAKDEFVISGLVFKHPDWPTYKSLDNKRKRRRPRLKKSEDDLNAVICYMFKAIFNIKQQEILAGKFGLSTRPDSDGRGKTTIKRWLAKGRKLITFDIEEKNIKKVK